VTDELHHRNEKVSRNRLSRDLEPIIAEYLGEIADQGSQEKLKQLYIESPALERILRAVEQRISFALPRSVLTAGGRVIETTETATVHREIVGRVSHPKIRSERRGFRISKRLERLKESPIDAFPRRHRYSGTPARSKASSACSRSAHRATFLSSANL
jgi:hypothetical protein